MTFSSSAAALFLLFWDLGSPVSKAQCASLNNSYRFNSPYRIPTAQGGFDLGFGPTLFDSLITPTGINGLLTYTTTDVDLTLMSALGQLPGLNVNQRNVANALDKQAIPADWAGFSAATSC
jgi:hypothetical protein